MRGHMTDQTEAATAHTTAADAGVQTKTLNRVEGAAGRV